MNHMPIEYKVYQETDDEVCEVRNFFEKVFPSTNLRRYFMDIMSEIFVGYNHRKHVYFLTGEGDNGKSITQMFFEKMLGKLSVKVPTTLITSKKPSIGAATDELARSGGGVRAMWLEEPDKDEELNQGLLKHLSGNDTFYSRGLYQNGREIDPMFTIFVVCNDLPKVKHGGDKAVWNRIRVIPFQSTFVQPSKCPDTIEEQLQSKKFPRDNSLDQRIPYLVQALAWLLLEHRNKPRIDDPEEVTSATHMYKEDNDIFALFIGECLIPDEKSSAPEMLVYEYCKEFFKFISGGKTNTNLNYQDFVKMSTKYLGRLNGSKMWEGYKVIAPRFTTSAISASSRELPPDGQVEMEIQSASARDFMLT